MRVPAKKVHNEFSLIPIYGDIICTCFKILEGNKVMANVVIPFDFIGLARTVDLMLFPMRFLVLLGTVTDSTAS